MQSSITTLLHPPPPETAKKRKSKEKEASLPLTTPINFYKLKSVQKHAKKGINPGFSTHHINVPFRGIIVAASGGGKTNALMNILRVFKNTFNHIYIFTKAQEQLYDWLSETIDKSLITIVYDNLGKLSQTKFYGQSLCIFDDMVNESAKAHAPIQELYIRGRKIEGGVSLLYLTQSYFRVPKLIRQQCNFVMLLKISNNRDVKLMVSEYGLGATVQQLFRMYEFCRQSGMENFFLIDLATNDEKTYRKNWTEYLTPSSF